MVIFAPSFYLGNHLKHLLNKQFLLEELRQNCATDYKNAIFSEKIQKYYIYNKLFYHQYLLWQHHLSILDPHK